jgi:hypothetical protein
MAKRKLSKEEMSRLLAKDVASMFRGMPIMHSAPASAFAPKVAKVATSKGRTSKVDLLKLREEILAEIHREQLNY